MKNKDTNDKFLKIMFSLTFILLALLKIFSEWFKERISSTTILLIIIAFLPWLKKYIKSIEIFGIKTNLVTDEEKRKIDREANKIKNINRRKKDEINFESINAIYEQSDSTIKLALISQSIERNLKFLCQNNKITDRLSNNKMIGILNRKNIISKQAYSMISNLLPILNKAVHGNIDDFKINDLDWIIEKGIDLVIYLEILVKNTIK